jgi:hypothetical protein
LVNAKRGSWYDLFPTLRPLLFTSAYWSLRKGGQVFSP